MSTNTDPEITKKYFFNIEQRKSDNSSMWFDSINSKNIFDDISSVSSGTDTEWITVNGGENTTITYDWDSFNELNEQYNQVQIERRIEELNKKIRLLEQLLEKANMLLSTSEVKGKDGLQGLWDKYCEEWREEVRKVFDLEKSFKISDNGLIVYDNKEYEEISEETVVENMKRETTGFVAITDIAVGPRNYTEMSRNFYIDSEAKVYTLAQVNNIGEHLTIERSFVFIKKTANGEIQVLDLSKHTIPMMIKSFNRSKHDRKLNEKVTEEVIDYGKSGTRKTWSFSSMYPRKNRKS